MLGRGGLGDWFSGRKGTSFDALSDISLEVGAGESLGIIGRNGSGKSTLLKILAGVTLPTRGEVIVHGRVASLLELGAGFHPMLTGRENVYLNAGLLGMRHAQVDAVFDEIVAFSGIGEFIDQPVDTYSSGMYVRIGFAVAAHTNPDIFLVDEVLSVGDEEFQRKCRRKIGELREQGKTIVFVSHDLGIVNTLCERIVLLNKGKMIVRDTPQSTINYYLRQVGRDKGVHTFARGELEAIHCDGRLSLFLRQRELTASSGCTMSLAALGQHHFSHDAEWEVTEPGENHCVARGRMTRLPIILIWEMRFEDDGRFTWRMAMECEHPIALQRCEALCCLPVAYTQWIYGDLAGAFPEIVPSDLAWNALVSPEAGEPDVAALAEAESEYPPLLVHLDAADRRYRFFWANSEYVVFSRLLVTQGIFPEQTSQFDVGRHELMTITLDATQPPEAVRERIRTTRTVRAGRLAARFEQGAIRLSIDDKPLTSFLHVYGSMLLAHLWHDSMSLQWGAPQPMDDGGLRLQGISRRFPFTQTWEIDAAPEGIRWTVWLDAQEDFDAQEYHCSVVLRSDYDRWETCHESGVFPPFDPEAAHWRHLNRSYAPGSRAMALSSTLPSVTLEVTSVDIPFRMTAINTRYDENARVLQALRPSEMGSLHFSTGRHLLFSGLISVSTEPGATDTRTDTHTEETTPTE
jgi:ABC-type polysaccharide/polyol phosphate transport system ATPase subunit